MTSHPDRTTRPTPLRAPDLAGFDTLDALLRHAYAAGVTSGTTKGWRRAFRLQLAVNVALVVVLLVAVWWMP